jgi:hypothetical protein
MTRSSTGVLAVAFIDGMSRVWRWHLKIDTTGLYRWYLDGHVWTGLRGVTREDADHALRRFADHSFHGDLIIEDAAE